MKKVLLIVVSFLIFTACEFDVYQNPDDEVYILSTRKSLEKQFDYIWKGLLTSYVFWDIDSTDWDRVWDTYTPKFKELDDRGQQGEVIEDKEIRELIESIMATMVDRHLDISMVNCYGKWKNRIRVFRSSLEMTNEDQKEINSYYMEERNLQLCDYVSEYSSFGITTCLVAERIPLLKMKDCFLSDGTDTTGKKREIADSFFANVKKLAESNSLQGIIFDFRNNGGGFERDIDYMLKKFINKPIKVLEHRHKTGLGKYDFGPWEDYVVSPDLSEYIDIHEVPIVILLNHHSASGGELVPYALHLLPNVHTIGTRTCGAHGVMTDAYEDFYSGSFNYSESQESCKYEETASVRTATLCTRLKKNDTGRYECLEGYGIEPDEYVPINYERLLNLEGDNQLDSAIEYIKKVNP